MLWNHQANRIAILGASGSGKTTFALRYIANTRAQVRWIFDPEGEFSFKLRVPAAKTLRAACEQIRTGWVVYDPDEQFQDPADGFAAFCDLAFQCSEKLPGRKLFVADEVQEYLSPQSIPAPAKSLVWRGRRRGIDLVLMSHEPALLGPRIRSQLTEIVTFQFREPAALDWLSAFGFDRQAVAELPRFAWISRTRTGGERRGGGLPAPGADAGRRGPPRSDSRSGRI